MSNIAEDRVLAEALRLGQIAAPVCSRCPTQLTGETAMVIRANAKSRPEIVCPECARSAMSKHLDAFTRLGARRMRAMGL